MTRLGGRPWLKLCTSSARDPGSIPGQRTKIVHAVQCDQKKGRVLGPKDMVHICNGILLSHKKNTIMPFAATWMKLKIVIMKQVRCRKTNIDIAYMWNLKKQYK